MSSEDIALIKTEKKNPCIKCGEAVFCCGCSEYDDYNIFIEELRQKNLYSIWRRYHTYIEKLDTIKALSLECNTLVEELKKDGVL